MCDIHTRASPEINVLQVIVFYLGLEFARDGREKVRIGVLLSIAVWLGYVCVKHFKFVKLFL